MKKVLVIGGGGREHAIVDAVSRSPQVGKIFCAPGNAGISAQAECVPIKDTDVEGLRDFALENGVDLTVVGPEVALAAGVTDAFRAAGLRILLSVLSYLLPPGNIMTSFTQKVLFFHRGRGQMFTPCFLTSFG